ncbi:TGF-beta-activated kinase 1 and MAP3K7-binding protein 1-like [Aricia agestis]|uniref:TGF-beta-activated kinase 1 and MAP3K7-binding protein 1-like n=1 Tax=Aricia agestis TaxID=91739 RepID=UPI001C207787|nr:TGF-beta-activated kinase 1 and MAP3K7-binding protein 1-like [Aricia agestis]XP_041985449.1 TGF-beta-activated kinase 1 and MAP3K7-binding protein 1-like [Aricia agestis]
MIARPWTDDLPKCKNTCVASYFSQLGGGSSSNDDYLCFYCQTEDNSCLYGVFEPHNGLDAARFIMQRMAAELLFPPPSINNSEDEIRERLRNAFVSVEKAYIENYDGMIAERTSLQYRLQTLNETQISQNCDNILLRLKEIDQHLSGGATVALALVHNDRLYVANVGETRALLCKTDDNSVLRVVQLTVDHSLHNEDELLRLSQLGLDVNKLRNAQYLGNQPGTRCLGNYLVKGLYRAFPSLGAAASEPVLAEPEIHGPIPLDESCRFLVLVSAAVYKRIQEVKGYEQTNKQLVQTIVENFRKQTDFRKSSQTVLQEIEEEFVSYCVKNNLTPKPNTHTSLLIRNFNFLPPIQSEVKPNVRFNPIVQSKSNTLLNEIDFSNEQSDTNRSIDSRSIDTNRSIESSDIYPSQPYDRDRRIKGYVDFSCYYENVAKARKNGTLPGFIK